MIRQITVWPSRKNPDLCFFWALMHQQHTLASLHLWAEAAAGVLPAAPSQASGPGPQSRSDAASYSLHGESWMECTKRDLNDSTAHGHR